MGVRQPAGVLITTDAVGGVWHYTVELARALSAQGVRVAIATIGPPPAPQQRAAIGALRSITLHEENFKLEWMDDPWSDIEQAGQWLLELERELEPDVVHLNQFAFGALPFAAPKLVVAHSCVLSWWLAVHGEAAPPSWNRYRDCVRRGLDSATLVAAPTHTMLQSIRDHYQYEREAIVIWNARSSVHYQPASKLPCIFTAGRLWDRAKNIEALDRAAPYVSWPIYLAGSNKHPDGGSSVTTHLHTLGELAPDALRNHLAHASIYALPARYEPFGLSILEAALSGCALVLGDIASLREVWGDAAIYVAPDDASALERALERLVADGQARERLARRARERALMYSPARMFGAYMNTYARLLAEHRARRHACRQPSSEVHTCAS